MEQIINDAIDEYTAKSSKGLLTFGELVMALSQLKVESYYADYRSNTITYYMLSGATYTVKLSLSEVNIAQAFDKQALQTAIRKAQQDEIRYPEFKRLSSVAGCVGYTVWIVGAQVTYFGRNGEIHVERFP